MKTRVIVVEDEPAILQGIVSLIRQLDLPLDVVGSYYNGQTALQNIEEVNPQIVITDVQMPIISGLELIRLIKKTGVDAEYLILSGYSDFAYVKEALKLNVHNYLLKPPRRSELKESLQYLCEKVQKKQYDSTQIMLQRLLTKNVLTEAPRFDLDTVQMFCYGAATPGRTYLLDQIVPPEKWNNQAIMQTLSEKQVPCDRIWVLDTLDPCVKFIVSSAASDSREMQAIIGALRTHGEQLPIPMSVVVDAMPRTLRDLPGSCRSCHAFLQQNTYFRRGGTVQVMQYSKKNSIKAFSFAEQELLQHVIRIGDLSALVDHMRSLTDKWCGQAVPQIEYLNAAKYAVTELAKFLGKDGSAAEAAWQEAVDTALISAETETEFCEDLCRLFRSMYLHHTKTDRLIVEVVDELEQLIQRAYLEEINVPEFAAQNGYHVNYLTTQFSRSKGISPKKMVLNMRMERARELLSGTNMQIKTIAQMMGFYDMSHFSRVFKEYTGDSPSAFREKWNERN